MTDAPRLTDERTTDSDDRNGDDWMRAGGGNTIDAAKALLSKYDKGESITISEGWLVRFASELVHAQQSEGAQAKVVEAAARRIVDALNRPASLMGGETAILNTKDVGLVARALLSQAERGREGVIEECKRVIDIELENGIPPDRWDDSDKLRESYRVDLLEALDALKRSGQESGEK